MRPRISQRSGGHFRHARQGMLAVLLAMATVFSMPTIAQAADVSWLTTSTQVKRNGWFNSGNVSMVGFTISGGTGFQRVEGRQSGVSYQAPAGSAIVATFSRRTTIAGCRFTEPTWLDPGTMLCVYKS